MHVGAGEERLGCGGNGREVLTGEVEGVSASSNVIGCNSDGTGMPKRGRRVRGREKVGTDTSCIY